MTFNVNHSVITPIGTGTFQARMLTVRNEVKFLVRLPINPETSKHLQDANCLTRRATQTGLWLFASDEVKAVQS